MLLKFPVTSDDTAHPYVASRSGDRCSDFLRKPDALIAAERASAGCRFTATFDKAMRALPATRVLR